jgi:ATP-binding cassette, subfamily F, member 3
MISAVNISKRLGGQTILEEITFRLGPGEKVALVGANGSGKSTLMRMCAGHMEPDGGEFVVPRRTVVGYLPQHADLPGDKTLYDHLRSGFSEVESYLEEAESLAHRMGEVDHESEEFEKILDRYGFVQHEIERLHAYTIDSEINRILAGLGFHPEDNGKLCGDFSGGWQMRIVLASVLLSNPDVLLLDEPTNHLDLETMIWLENWIRSSDASVLLVSHERKFMDALATRVFELHEGHLTVYQGNYTGYISARAERWAQWQREYDRQQEEIAHIQKFIDRFRYNAAKAALVQSRVKQLEKIERIQPPPKPPRSIGFRFPPADRGSKEVAAIENGRKAYGDFLVLDTFDFAVWRGEKVALVGLNGAGKSTLLKILAGIETLTSGTLQRGARTRSEYFAQYDTAGLTTENTVWQEICTVAPTGHLESARELLGCFFFTGDDVNKPVGVLSGGEKTRLRLAKMLFSSANLLLLDEPTNHLDISSRQTLERSMQDYDGTAVFVSHDRAFLDAIATRVVEIKDGRVRSFPGNYTEYCLALRALGEDSPLIGSGGGSRRGARPTRDASPGAAGPAEGEADDATPAPVAPANSDVASDGLSNQQRREAAKEAQRERRKLEKRVAELEQEVADLESKISAVDEQLARADLYQGNPSKWKQLLREQTDLKDRHATVLKDWEALAAQLESLQATA